MAFNAGVVGFGLSQVFISLFKMTAPVAYSFWAIVLAIDLSLLYRYLKTRNKVPEPEKVPMPVVQSS